jgi:hypothetical protein
VAQTKFSSVVLFLGAFFFASNLLAQDKVRIAYVGPSLSNLPLLAANENGILARHKLSSWSCLGQRRRADARGHGKYHSRDSVAGSLR